MPQQLNPTHPVHINGQPVQLQHAHRDVDPPVVTEPLATITATVELTAEEVTAILFDWIADGGEFHELHDDNRVRLFIAETVVNGGCLRVDEKRADASWASGELLEECGRRAREVFGSPNQTSPRNAPTPLVFANLGSSRVS